MKKKAQRALHKNIKLIIVVVIVAIFSLGVLLMLISGNEDRDQVEIKSDQTTEQRDKERKKENKNDHPGVSDEALALYNARVDDMTDPSAVAQLIEATTLRETVSGYVVTLHVKEDDAKGMTITLDKTVAEGERAQLDETMILYAEQLLALTSESVYVKWEYVVETEKKEETVDEMLTVKHTKELLELPVKDYAESPETVQTLLNQQKGII